MSAISPFKHARANPRHRAVRTRLEMERLEERCVPDATGFVGPLPTEPLDYNPSRIVVRFQPDAAIASGADILSGTELDWASTLVPGLRVVELAEWITVDAAVAAYRGSPRVLYAQPDPVVRLAGSVMPNDPFFPGQWSLHNTGQTYFDGNAAFDLLDNPPGTADADIDAPEAWGVTTGSGRMVVALIDSGIDKSHPDLAANIWTNPGEIPGRRRGQRLRGRRPRLQLHRDRRGHWRAV